jgi:large subunit ribosomal protein L16
MLKPNQKKFRKNNKGRSLAKIEPKTNLLKFGTHGIQALEKGRITARQIEAVRRTITNYLRRKGKVWIRIFPDFPITNKPSEVRMGKGKGNVAYWVCNVKPGRILYELSGSDYILLENALKYALIKLPLAAKVIINKYL